MTGLFFFAIVVAVIVFGSWWTDIESEERQREIKDEEAKKRAAVQKAAENRKNLPALKAQFLARNSAFPQKIIDDVLCRRNEFPWIINPNKFLQKEVTVFLGYDDLYVIEGTPGAQKYNFDNGYIGEEGRLWPHTFYFTGFKSQGTFRKHEYKYLTLNYFQLGFANIAPYSDAAMDARATKKDVLRWITEDVRSKFRSRHPEFTVSQVEISEEINGSKAYCYFTYKTSASETTGWK